MLFEPEVERLLGLIKQEIPMEPDEIRITHLDSSRTALAVRRVHLAIDIEHLSGLLSCLPFSKSLTICSSVSDKHRKPRLTTSTRGEDEAEVGLVVEVAKHLCA